MHYCDLMAESDPGGLWSKSVYDGVGHDTMDYTTDGAGGTTWADAGSVANDTVLEQTQTVYDADSNVIETIYSQRFHNATGTGPLGSPTSGIGARVYYAASYYDAADRLTADVDVGTNGGVAWTRPSSPPTPSNTVLVTSYSYNAAGWVQDVTDPMGIDERTYYDALGRVTKTIQDYTGGTPGNENDVTTEYGYDGDNNVTYVQADEPGGGYQQTAYVYAATTGNGDGLNSNDILTAIQHPDPTTGNPSVSQQDSYVVDALGEVTQATDRNGNVHQYSYDVLGRLTSDAVTTLGAGVDGSIRRIEYAYDSQGNNSLITSYNAASGGSIVNQVERVYNGLGQLTGEYQSHSGAVNTSSTPEVQYAYTEMSGGQNNSRLVSMTYANNSYTLDYNYNAGLDSNISRLSSISDGVGTVESYLYLGLDTVVERDHPQSDINLTYIQQSGDTLANSDGGDQYTGLDRFGRVIDQFWVNSSTGSTVDRYQYGYDADSDVLYRQNMVDSVFSELYTYDNLNQLTSMERGTLNATHNGISSPSQSQSWSPDALGNFNSVTTDGMTQTRSANQQNEITSISGQSNPTYDANGNLTADGAGNTYVYDAWNRLVSVSNNGTVVATYSYDGLGRRIQETHGTTTTDLYLSSEDQVLSEYQGSTLTAYNVWSPVYVNALIARTVGNGRMYTTYYILQDANWNVTAVVLGGTVMERYDYDAYGLQTVLAPNWSLRGTSSYNIPYSFQSMRTDWTVSLVLADNRVYSPTLSRWLQPDLIGLRAGNNYYEFANNGPAGAVDPSGLMSDNPRDLYEEVMNYLDGVESDDELWGKSAEDIAAEIADEIGADPEDIQDYVDAFLEELDEIGQNVLGQPEKLIPTEGILSAAAGRTRAGLQTVGEAFGQATATTKAMFVFTGVFVGSVLLPGPENVIMAALARTKGLRVIIQGGKRIWAKVVGNEVKCLTETEASALMKEYAALSKGAPSNLSRVSGEVRGYWQKQLQNNKITEAELRKILHPEDVTDILRKLGKKAGTIPHDKEKIIYSIQKSLDAAKRAPDDLAKGRISQEEFDSIMRQAEEIMKAQGYSR